MLLIINITEKMVVFIFLVKIKKKYTKNWNFDTSSNFDLYRKWVKKGWNIVLQFIFGMMVGGTLSIFLYACILINKNENKDEE